MTRVKIQHVLHRCADCSRSVSIVVGDPLLCSCGGAFVIDTKYRPDLADEAADQRAAVRAAKAAAAKPTNGKHHPLFDCETCKDSKTVIVDLVKGAAAGNRTCPDCIPTAVGA